MDIGGWVLTALLAALAGGAGDAAAPTAAPSGHDLARELAGSWSATLEHAGETTSFGLRIEPAGDGRARVSMTIPAIHVDAAAVGTFAIESKDGEVALGPFRLAYDRAAGTLRGVVPADLAPVHVIPLVLRRATGPAAPAVRREAGGSLVRPLWTFDAGSAVWAGPTFAGDAVYVGAQNGGVHCLDAATGARRWSFAAAGPVRTRPTVADGRVLFQADDGVLYALDSASGAPLWQLRVVPRPIERLPFDDPKSRYDRFGSDVTAVEGRLYLGTHDGRLVCVDAASGREIWSEKAGEAILAAPAVSGGQVFFGTFDGKVIALDSRTGARRWVHDAKAAVVSTPALADGKLIVGTRGYDLLALEAETGRPAWRRYLWFSWVESSASVRDGFVYVGSSDAAAVYSFEASSGRLAWKQDVRGWAWGQPALGDTRVYVGTSSQVGYPSGHRAGVLALDRASGRVVWRLPAEAPETGSFGFPGSPAVGGSRVFVGGLDGRVHALAP